ncbi:MAG TPA: hypothetical protein VMD08_15430, partial [Candidatus Baltobacteraceae bacterium]|nr:hypothetical protein [Candidatus Baltobacteraceae bacterium]
PASSEVIPRWKLPIRSKKFVVSSAPGSQLGSDAKRKGFRHSPAGERGWRSGVAVIDQGALRFGGICRIRDFGWVSLPPAFPGRGF